MDIFLEETIDSVTQWLSEIIKPDCTSALTEADDLVLK